MKNVSLRHGLDPVQDTLIVHHQSFAPMWQKYSEDADTDVSHTFHNAQAFYDQHAHALSDL